MRVTINLKETEKVNSEYGVLSAKEWMQKEVTRLDRPIFSILKPLNKKKPRVTYFNTLKECDKWLKEDSLGEKKDYKIVKETLKHKVMKENQVLKDGRVYKTLYIESCFMRFEE